MRGMKRSPGTAVCVVLALLVALAVAGCGTSKPTVKSVAPNKGLPGTGFTISGKSLGSTQGKSTVTMGSKKSIVVSWSDTSITATVPNVLVAGSYPVIVKTAGGVSNKVSYTVFASFTGSTPLPAMLEFLKNRKVDTKGMTFTALETSTSDSNWKIDKATKTGGPTYYFLFHKTADGWKTADFGESFSAHQLKIDGAPSDLKPPV